MAYLVGGYVADSSGSVSFMNSLPPNLSDDFPGPSDRGTLETLDEQACLQLLGAQDFGRVGVVVDDHPEIFPVNYVLERNTILFRTDDGTKLSASHAHSVCFQIDGTSEVEIEGWSVLVVGHAREIVNQIELTEAMLLKVKPWVQGRKAHWVRIEPTSITGRTIRSSA